MSRKRGKQRKTPVEAVPEEVLAEGSAPVRQVEQDAIGTVDDVVTTDDIATTEDVVTADDVVATAEPTPARGAPQRAADAGKPRRGRPRKTRRPAGTQAAPESEEGADTAGAAAQDSADGDTAGDAEATDARDTAEAADGNPDGSGVGAGPDAADVDAADAPTEAASEDADASFDGEPSAEDLCAAADAEHPETIAEDATEGAADGLGDGDLEGAAGGEDDDDAAGVFPTSAATMDTVQLKHLVEALVFASDRPLTVQRLRQLTRVSDVRRLEQALSEIAEDYRERGLVIQQVSGGYQFRTRTQFSPWVQQLIAGRPVRLSRAQLETLAIIAYRQPITRPEIDDIRGVDSTATLKLLIDRMLIRILGKREEVGRPMLYGTTKEFLDFFSLGDLRELPTLREYSELTAESRKVMSDRLGIAADGSDGPAGDGGDPDDGSGNGHGGNGSNGHGGNGHGGNGHGGNGHGGNGHGGDGGAGGFGSGGGLPDDGPPASAAADDDAGMAAPEDDSIAELVEHGIAVSAAEDHLAPAMDSDPDRDPATAAGTEADVVAAARSDDDGAVGIDDLVAEAPEDADGSDRAPTDEVADALSAFWAASDAVDRSSAAALGDSDDDAPADTWFDPSISDSSDDRVAADGLDDTDTVEPPNHRPPVTE
ncbi:MAG TPA: SMC-Scp complex subunit ScpB [Kofleriaceae bacterium]|nr:SMC-Scp complex subunit ScpB [Kofleriaceae bacterium]